MEATMNAISSPARTANRILGWSLADLMMMAGILVLLLAAIAVPAFASQSRTIRVGQEDVESAMRQHMMTTFIVARLSERL
jgi:hypothetical protein